MRPAWAATSSSRHTIHKLRFAGGRVWAATLRGVWYHSASTTSGSWTLAYAPNPANLTAPLQAYTIPGSAERPDVRHGVLVADQCAVQEHRQRRRDRSERLEPRDRCARLAQRRHVQRVLRDLRRRLLVDEGEPDRRDPGERHRLRQLRDVGRRLEAVRDERVADAAEQGHRQRKQLPGRDLRLEQRLAGRPVVEDRRLAEARELRLGAEAVRRRQGLRPRDPGLVQPVPPRRPDDPNHIYAGLEEVYESKNGGSSWSTVGPYWNFYFSCWAPDSVYPPNGTANRCPQTTHPDQHSIAVGGSGNNQFVVVGNDGGIYKRPLNGTRTETATRPTGQSLNDGSIDALQFYAVDVGKVNPVIHSTPEGTVDETSSTDTATASGRRGWRRRAACWSAAASRTTAAC